MTHPPNSYHYQPATDFESQEPEHMYQQSHPTQMSQSYEGGGQRGQQQQGASGHPRRNSSLTPHQTSPQNMIYYYDWKNFPMAQAPGSFLPSPEEANLHGQGHMPGSAMATAPYPFATGAPFPPSMLPPPPSSVSAAAAAAATSSLLSATPGSAAAYSHGSLSGDPALAASSMSASNFMPGPSPNFNNSMSYNYIPALPPPFGEPYFQSNNSHHHHHHPPHHRASGPELRSHSGGPMGDGLSYPVPYLPSHFPGPMGSSRLASPPAHGFPSGIGAELYPSPPPHPSSALPYHPMMMGHATNLYYQNPSRSASPSVTYSTSPSPSPSHYSHGGSSFACHPFSRPSLPPGGSSMAGSSGGSGPRLACRPCIRGHRAPSCKHTDRPLFAIRPRGRPSSQCIHCKEARKTGGIHVKCLCGNGSPASKSSSVAYASALDMHKSGGMVAAEPPSAMLDSGHVSSSPSQHAGARSASSKSALAAVMQSFWSGIHGSETSAHEHDSDRGSKTAQFEENLHRRSLSVEATDTVSQKPPEASQSVDFDASETQPEIEPMNSQCICNLGMPCLCGSKAQMLPEHAEPASIASGLRQHREPPSQPQQRVHHSNQPLDHNSYEYDRLSSLHDSVPSDQEREDDELNA